MNLKKVSSLLDSIIEWSGRIFMWAIVPLTLLSVFEVVTRRFFGTPTIWSFEVIKQIYGFYFMMVAAYGLLHKSHVAIDIFTMKFSEKKRAVIDLLGYIVFFFPFVIVCLWKGYLYALDSWIMKETSWTIFSPPLYPIKTVIVISFLLLILQGVSECIKNVNILRGVEI